MTLHFKTNIEGIKSMVSAIEKETRCKAIQKKESYFIGDYKLTQDGALSFDDNLGGDPKAFEHSACVIDECIMACGLCPSEFDEFN